MQKHIPVLLNNVLAQLHEIQDKEISVLDCTLGQAGHSIEIFNTLKKGVLVSIDLDIKAIEWVKTNYELDPIEGVENAYCLKLENKTWFVLQYDFADIENISEQIPVRNFDFILADLGFSNLQLRQNKGISFQRLNQRLDMRYNSDSDDITAAEVLNTSSPRTLENIFSDLGQIPDAKILVNDIINRRANYRFEKVSDALSLVGKKKYPASYKTKFFQALRSYVNKENERLTSLLERMPLVLNDEGKVLIITFNSLEENIVKSSLSNVIELEPNITEIISNPQSRSAKLYIYKKTSIKDS
jgi:16S rRNA (cytosine1402-N4)-methyltransferase